MKTQTYTVAYYESNGRDRQTIENLSYSEAIKKARQFKGRIYINNK